MANAQLQGMPGRARKIRQAGECLDQYAMETLTPRAPRVGVARRPIVERRQSSLEDAVVWRAALL